MQSTMWMRALVIGAACASLAAAAQTNVYRWVDRDGKVHFTDTPPPRDAVSASEKVMGGGAVDEGQVPYATQVAARRHPVVLYTGDDCDDYCGRARDLLSRRGVPFSEKNAQRSPKDADALKALIGALEVPVLLVGDNVVKGFNEDTWQSALDGAGYARTRLPGQPGPRPR